jgi:hypothetical protein
MIRNRENKKIMNKFDKKLCIIKKMEIISLYQNKQWGCNIRKYIDKYKFDGNHSSLML